jgi:hypothetical protein
LVTVQSDAIHAAAVDRHRGVGLKVDETAG